MAQPMRPSVAAWPLSQGMTRGRDTMPTSFLQASGNLAWRGNNGKDQIWANERQSSKRASGGTRPRGKGPVIDEWFAKNLLARSQDLTDLKKQARAVSPRIGGLDFQPHPVDSAQLGVLA